MSAGDGRSDLGKGLSAHNERFQDEEGNWRERANRLYAKVIDITLYSEENGEKERVLVGECLNISRTGFGANVKPVSRLVNTENLVGRRLVVQFHLPGIRFPAVNCTVKRTDSSEDIRYELFIGAEFDNEVDLSPFVSRLLSLSR